MKRKWRWRWLEVSRAQRGWVAEVTGTVETHQQSTWRVVGPSQESSSRYLLLAVWRAFWCWRRTAKAERKMPGPFNN